MEFRENQVNLWVDQVKNISNMIGPVPDASGELRYGDEYIDQIIEEVNENIIDLSQATKSIYYYLINEVANQHGEVYRTMFKDFQDTYNWVRQLEIEVNGKPFFELGTSPVVKEFNQINNYAISNTALDVLSVTDAITEDSGDIETDKDVETKATVMTDDIYKTKLEQDIKNFVDEEHEFYITNLLCEVFENPEQVNVFSFKTAVMINFDIRQHDEHKGAFYKHALLASEQAEQLETQHEQLNLSKSILYFIKKAAEVGDYPHKPVTERKERIKIKSYLGDSPYSPKLRIETDQDALAFVLLKLAFMQPLFEVEFKLLNDLIAMNELHKDKKFMENFLEIIKAYSHADELAAACGLHLVSIYESVKE